MTLVEAYNVFSTFVFSSLTYGFLALVTILSIVVPAAFIFVILFCCGMLIESLTPFEIEKPVGKFKWIFIALCVFCIPLGVKVFAHIKDVYNQRDRVIINKPVRVERFKLNDLRPPKHVYVELQHVRTGAVYSNVFVAKHCNSYKSNQLGSEYNIQTQDWYYEDEPEKVFIKFLNLSDTFCS